MLNKILIVTAFIMLTLLTIHYYKKIGVEAIIITLYTGVWVSIIEISVFLLK